MPKRLAIGGTGGLAREVWGWFHTAGGRHILDEYDSVSFYVDTPELAANAGDLQVSLFEALNGSEPFDYLIAVFDPSLKRKMEARFSERGGKPATFIHRSAIIGRNVVLGPGCLVCPNATISSDARIGRTVLVNVGSGIAHDCIVGDYTSLLGHVALNGRCKVGSDVVIGSGATIHPGRRIGDKAVVGIGSTVLSHVPPGVTVLGNPARRISSVRSEK